MTLMKSLFALALSLALFACVDELDDTTQEPPTDVDETSDVTDGIPSEPELPEDGTCATQRKADGACLP